MPAYLGPGAKIIGGHIRGRAGKLAARVSGVELKQEEAEMEYSTVVISFFFIIIIFFLCVGFGHSETLTQLP